MYIVYGYTYKMYKVRNRDEYLSFILWRINLTFDVDVQITESENKHINNNNNNVYFM